MQKLTKLETLAVELAEAKKARKAYKEQRWQYRKRLWYLPLILRVVLALAIALAFCYLYEVETVGTEPTAPKSIVIVHPAPCRLPTTGVE